MSDPAVVAALAAAGGVVAGSMVSSMGVLFRERVVSRREREARQALRVQERADERAVFQRESILALQDALEDLWALSMQAKRGERSASSETTPGLFLPPPEFGEIKRRIDRLRSRVFDDRLRDLALTLQMELAIFVTGPESRPAPSNELQAINECVNALLRNLY